MYAQIPSGYYDNASGLDDGALKSALNNIIDGHTEFPYYSSGTDTWDILKISDRDRITLIMLFAYIRNTP